MNKSAKSSVAIAQSPPDARVLSIRKALMSDILLVLGLINRYASLGIMLPRTEFELSESIRDFTVAVSGTQVVGCGALHFYGPATGEVRSLAVEPGWKNRGVGTRLMEALEAEARANGLLSIFAFTYVTDFFARLGFVEVDRQELPSKVWKDCLRCPKLQCCDEIAMRKILRPDAEREPTTRICGDLSSDQNGHIVLPTLRKDSD